MQGREDCAGKCCGHVLLRIPDVALRPEISDAEVGSNNLGNDSFQNFEETTQCRDCRDGQPCSPRFTSVGRAPQKFAHWIDQQKTESEMNYAIKMISLQMEKVAEPKTDRDFRVGVMRTDCMKRQEEQDQRIG